MTIKTYSLRLEGLSVPDGEISLRDLVEIGGALQTMATRIARQVGNSEGRGAPPASIDRMSELRLTGVDKGSTTLLMRLGDVGALPFIEGGEEGLLIEHFEDGFTAISKNAPPKWASPLVVEAIGRVAARVHASGATRATTSWGFGTEIKPQVTIDLSAVDLTVWKVEEQKETERVRMTGRLDKVDLRARRFRVRDDVGHDITLEDVVDIDAAATLIGRRVVASGVAEREAGRVVRIVEPTLTSEELPPDWFVAPVSELPIGAPIPRGGIPGVTVEEAEAFLAEIRS